MDLADEILMDRLRGGEKEQALGSLLERYWSRGYRVALRVTGEPTTAEDALQDAFVRVLRKGDQFDPTRGEFRPWFFRIVENTARNARRSSRRRQDHENRLPPRSASRQTDQVEWVLEELSRLDEDLRAAVTLKHVEGMSYREIGETLGWPEGTAVTRIKRGIGKLRKRMSVEQAGVAGVPSLSSLLQSDPSIPVAPSAGDLIRRADLALKATDPLLARGLTKMLLGALATLAIGLGAFLAAQGPTDPIAIAPQAGSSTSEVPPAQIDDSTSEVQLADGGEEQGAPESTGSAAQRKGESNSGGVSPSQPDTGSRADATPSASAVGLRSGVIVDALTGNPIEGALVTPTRDNSSGFLRSTTTDPTGGFVVAEGRWGFSDAEGEDTLRVYHPLYAIRSVSRFSSERRIGLQRTYQGPTGHLRLAFQDQAGKPLGGPRITLSEEPSARIEMSTFYVDVPEAGSVTLELPGDGLYGFTCAVPGYTPFPEREGLVSTKGEVSLTSGTVENVCLVFQKNAEIVLRVAGASGASKLGLTIKRNDVVWLNRSVAGKPEGTFVELRETCPPGEIEVLVTDTDQGLFGRVAFPVSAGQIHEETLSLSSGAQRYFGQTLADNQWPVKNASLEFTLSSGASASTRGDTQGGFELRTTDPPLSVKVQAAGFVPTEFEISPARLEGGLQLVLQRFGTLKVTLRDDAGQVVPFVRYGLCKPDSNAETPALIRSLATTCGIPELDTPEVEPGRYLLTGFGAFRPQLIEVRPGEPTKLELRTR